MNDMENRVERIMETACELCHAPYAETDQAALDERCSQCPLEKIVKEQLAAMSRETAETITRAFTDSIREVVGGDTV